MSLSGETCLPCGKMFSPVKLPAGTTGVPSPGMVREGSALIVRYETKEEQTGQGTAQRHAGQPTWGQPSGYGGPRKSACQDAARRAKPEGHTSLRPGVMPRTW